MTIENIKELRELTGAGVMEVKNALSLSKGDLEKAKELLKKQGKVKAEKKSERTVKQGLIEAYVHLGKIGAMVEVNCETDFVARNEEFKNFVHEIALQVAASETESVEELLKEPLIKDEMRTVGDALTQIIQKTGENIKIARFVRFRLGG